MMNEEKILQQILNRLNVLIALQLESLIDKDKSTISSKIHKLSELGLSPTEISSILNKKLNSVTSILSKKRKLTNKK